MSLNEVKLGEVCLVKRGTTITQKQAIEGNIPVVAGGLKPTYYHNQANRFNTTITISGSGANAGFVNLWKQPIFASDCSTVEVKDSKLDIQYVYYFLLSKQNYIYKKLRNGAAQPHVYGKDIAELLIHIPSIATQQKIVSRIDTIFAEIEKATTAAEANSKNAEALMESYLKEVFENCDDGYKEFQLGDICKIIGGGTPSKTNPRFYEGDIPWATVRDMKEEVIKETDFKINAEAVSQSSTNIIPKNNVIIATRVGLGKVCIIENDTAINQDLRGVIPIKPNLIEVMYLFYWFKSIAKMIIDAGRGATVHGVTLPFVKSLKIKVPDISKQRSIISNIQNIQSNINVLNSATNKKINELQLLKQSILQKVFNGELIKD